MPLSTSYIPGHVYLYKHKYLSISVNGAFKIGTVGYYTDITEVIHPTPDMVYHYPLPLSRYVLSNCLLLFTESLLTLPVALHGALMLAIECLN